VYVIEVRQHRNEIFYFGIVPT